VHLPGQARRAAPVGEDQVVDGAQESERQRLGVRVGPDPAQLLLGIEIGGEVPLDVPEPACAVCGSDELARLGRS
jgi:hypothetical protein